MLIGGETVSRNDGVVVVYQSCRQSSASSHGRRYRVARVSRYFCTNNYRNYGTLRVRHTQTYTKETRHELSYSLFIKKLNRTLR